MYDCERLYDVAMYRRMYTAVKYERAHVPRPPLREGGSDPHSLGQAPSFSHISERAPLGLRQKPYLEEVLAPPRTRW